jgi:hypothetical protein
MSRYPARIVLAGFVLATALFSAAAGDDAIRINAEGTFNDGAVWTYETADHKFRIGALAKGTNETLIMPSPAPKPGERLAGITHLHHAMQTYGYPLHVSLLDKLFANNFGIEVAGSNEGELWKYEAKTAIAQETMITGKGRPPFTAAGPILSSGPVPEKYTAALAYLRQVLSSVTNLAREQRDLSHYYILFVETKDAVWMELGPSWAPDEPPHLGCQTKLGRDMVFAFEKSPAVAGRNGGPWLQCF